jgi:hypothetical protein
VIVHGQARQVSATWPLVRQLQYYPAKLLGQWKTQGVWNCKLEVVKPSDWPADLEWFALWTVEQHHVFDVNETEKDNRYNQAFVHILRNMAQCCLASLL